MLDKALEQLIRAKARISDPAKHLRGAYHSGKQMCSFYALGLEVIGAPTLPLDWMERTLNTEAYRVLTVAAGGKVGDVGVFAIFHANDTLPHPDLMAVWDKAIAARAKAVGEPVLRRASAGVTNGRIALTVP